MWNILIFCHFQCSERTYSDLCDIVSGNGKNWFDYGMHSWCIRAQTFSELVPTCSFCRYSRNNCINHGIS